MIRCFWLEPTDQIEMSLRRFRYSESGPGSECPHGRHDASVIIGRSSVAECPYKHEGSPLHGDLWPHSDVRWPAHCACGYAFLPDDQWQFNPHSLFRRSDTGELVPLHRAPAGAMWNAEWMGDRYRGPDGIVLCVRTPGGDWLVDGPASNGPGWQRSGEVPNVTATPSILMPRYHGWLRDGALVEC